MRKLSKNYFASLGQVMTEITVSIADAAPASFHDGVEAACHLIVTQSKGGKKLMFIGNGASASIASHMSTDFWKNGGMRATAFNDSSLLTCIGNDYGYRHLFEKPVEMFAESGDILVAISSSGKSENILRGVQAARGKGCKVITMSGFQKDNPLLQLGDINFYVPADEYGPVEILHTAICHGILDVIMKGRDGQV
jgi:D-sedoheptulose 7-phosphate isomerase